MPICERTRMSPSNYDNHPASQLSTATRDKLAHVSTATICTALFKRGLRNAFIQDVHPLNPALPNMVGEAFTLRYIPAREDLNPITVFQDRSHPQRMAVEQCPRRRGDGDRQPQGCARRLGRLDPGDAADDARRRRRRHRRRLPRLAGDRAARDSRLSPPAERADQPDDAPGARHQRADRLRRRRRCFPATSSSATAKASS